MNGEPFKMQFGFDDKFSMSIPFAFECNVIMVMTDDFLFNEAQPIFSANNLNLIF